VGTSAESTDPALRPPAARLTRPVVAKPKGQATHVDTHAGALSDAGSIPAASTINLFCNKHLRNLWRQAQPRRDQGFTKLRRAHSPTTCADCKWRQRIPLHKYCTFYSRFRCVITPTQGQMGLHLLLVALCAPHHVGGDLLPEGRCSLCSPPNRHPLHFLAIADRFQLARFGAP